jgi:hypothetical protein
MMPKSVILTVATWIVDEEPPHLAVAGFKKNDFEHPDTQLSPS